MIEYLKAWIFANKAREKKGMEPFNDFKATEYVERLVDSLEKLTSTGLVEKTTDGNFVLAQLADAQVQVRQLENEIKELKETVEFWRNKNVEIQDQGE